MATEWQLEKMAEEHRVSKSEDFKGNKCKDSNVEAKPIVIYKGYNEYHCPQCSGSIIYPASWKQGEGMCVNCCQSFVHLPDTEKSKQEIKHKPVIRLHFNIK